jgi:hypothetical protein
LESGGEYRGERADKSLLLLFALALRVMALGIEKDRLPELGQRTDF